MTVTLRQLANQASIAVLDHLELEATIPIVDGPQAQGDLLVLPGQYVQSVTVPVSGAWREVPPSGVELLRGAAGGNTHTLVADPGVCEWTSSVLDDSGLAIGMLRASAPVYLIHAEHGATGIAAGTYVIRRQREAGTGRWEPGYRSIRLVAD